MQHDTTIEQLVFELGHLESAHGVGTRGGGRQPVGEQVKQFEFTTESPCHSVAVFMAADGSLSDIVLDGAWDRLSTAELSRVLTETIQRAEQNLQLAIAELARQRAEQLASTETTQ